jgi:ankyrin repeat protein
MEKATWFEDVRKCIESEDGESLSALVDQVGHINWVDESGQTALHLACYTQGTTCLSILLKHGQMVDLNIQG